MDEVDEMDSLVHERPEGRAPIWNGHAFYGFGVEFRR
jgi:hypothetical protein